MGAGHPAVRNRLGGRMGTPASQQFRQQVGVRSIRALAVCRGDRLIDLESADAADEYPVRLGRQNDAHCWIAGLEQRTAGVAA